MSKDLMGDILSSVFLKNEELFNNGHEFEFVSFTELDNIKATDTSINNSKHFKYDDIKHLIRYKCIGVVYPKTIKKEFGSKVTVLKMCIRDLDLIKSGLYKMFCEEQIAIIDTRDVLRPCKVYRLVSDTSYTLPSNNHKSITILFWDLIEISR